MALTTAGDIFQLRNSTSRTLRIIEIRIGQTNITALENLAVQLVRGTGGSTGTALTEYEWNVDGPAATATAASRATSFGTEVDSGGVDLDYGAVWNILQEFVWLPTPDLELIIPPSFDLGIGISVPNASTSINVNVVWQES